jgi:hypothetical protein
MKDIGVYDKEENCDRIKKKEKTDSRRSGRNRDKKN